MLLAGQGGNASEVTTQFVGLGTTAPHDVICQQRNRNPFSDLSKVADHGTLQPIKYHLSVQSHRTTFLR